MKTIVYFADGSIEETSWADIHIAKGIARAATDSERLSYERQFIEDDSRIAKLPNPLPKDPYPKGNWWD